MGDNQPRRVITVPQYVSCAAVRGSLYVRALASYSLVHGRPKRMVPQFPYLTACIDEALRLYPPASGTARVARSDCTLCGYSIPKGTFLNVAVPAATISPTPAFNGIETGHPSAGGNRPALYVVYSHSSLQWHRYSYCSFHCSALIGHTYSNVFS